MLGHMKFVAKRAFVNNLKPPIELDWYVKGADGKPLTNHIHKGARFRWGSADKFDDLPQPEKETVALLVKSQAVTIDDGAPDSNSVIAKIDAEIASDKALEKRDRQWVWREQHRWTFDRRLVLYGILIAIVGIIAYLVLR